MVSEGGSIPKRLPLGWSTPKLPLAALPTLQMINQLQAEGNPGKAPVCLYVWSGIPKSCTPLNFSVVKDCFLLTAFTMPKVTVANLGVGIRLLFSSAGGWCF